MNEEARKRHVRFGADASWLPKPSPTPFDNPKSLRERIAYPLARMAYQAGRSDGRQEGFKDGLTIGKQPGSIGLLAPKFSDRHSAWKDWADKWAHKTPDQHDRWVFDEGLRAGIHLMFDQIEGRENT